MRKSIYFSLSLFILVFLSVCTIQACKKEIKSPENENVTRAFIPECLQGYHYDTYLKKCIPDCPAGYEWSERSGTCIPSSNVTATYAGVSITYESASKMLKFRSVSDLRIVLDQLEADYENHNANYENQYPNLTAAELDNMDAITAFDAARPYKDFEARFGTYSSQRRQLENLEAVYLASNFTGTDPDSVDVSYDDELNTIMNKNNQFKVGTEVYTLKEDGMYVSSGSPQVAKLLGPACFTNRRKKQDFPNSGETEMYELKVAIHSNIFSSSVKGKVVHFRKKNGNWKRERKDLSIGIAGTYYDADCNNPTPFGLNKPISGFRKRGEIKVALRSGAGFVQVWKTMDKHILARYDAGDNQNGLYLTYY